MNILDLPTGLHPSVPEAVYHARVPGMASKGALDLVDAAPAKYKVWIDGGADEDTAALAFGRAFHCAVLEPERFAATYAVAPDVGDRRYVAAKEAYAKWQADNIGKTILSADDAKTIRGMTSAIRTHRIAGRLITGGVNEITARWQDAETGLQCRARADKYVERIATLVDLKSTQDASARGFAKSVANYRYHVQDAWYRDGFNEAGAHVKHLVFVAVEKAEPYLVAVYALDDVAVERGRSAYRRNITTLAECTSTGNYPGYPDNIQQLELPPWAA